MAKSPTQRVAETKARRIERGERLIQVWVPRADAAAIAEIRARAARACAEAADPKNRPSETGETDA